jgi:hypothetical protein
MVNEELITAIRLVVRDEVVAGEQRTAQRFGKMDERFGKMDERLTRIEIAQELTQNNVEQLTVHMIALETKVVQFQDHISLAAHRPHLFPVADQ